MLQAASIGLLLLAAGPTSVLAQPNAADDSPSTAPGQAPASVTAGNAERYPARPISSLPLADAALADVARQRALLEAQRLLDERTCAPKFFTTRCLDTAQERRRATLASLRLIEIEANAFKRQARVAERDQVLNEKNAKAAQDAQGAQRELKISGPAAPVGDTKSVSIGAAPDAAASSPAKVAPPPMPAKPREPRQTKPLAHPIDARTQAQNIASFEKKARESAQRQRAIAEKKAEKERDRARKKAAEPATTPPTLPPQ